MFRILTDTVISQQWLCVCRYV